ncbi:MAG TPA: protein phosphatase 2C domain-containing protein [Candidatus Nesterenkonia stercoripullorum]|uniref:Protein phosphatase 2C domain-containing protein n=1 Tax=Candidatus Nesterenkonia stercoripullorum TaxID=2838701 RepID=A0A9D1S0Q7_9MICC|nr:protein phosphatase 2C domain-containing protein [Candidatus Nesterenkonia stercoripullorum]
MALVFRFAARSETGVVRSKNDDSGYAGRYFAVVADGMGGHAGGDVASASTVLDLAHLDTHGFAEPDTVLPDEIQTANAFLNRLVQANPKLAGMGTTITSLLITDNRLQFAHIGDSRAYRLKKGRFRQVSKDHTFVQRLVDEGRLKPDEAEYHPHKNVLMRVLGDVDASPELDITSFPLEVGERWLLCSDGLNAVVSERLIEQKLRSSQPLESVVSDLVDLTIEGGAPDNVTVVCLEVVEADEAALIPNRDLPLSEAAVAAASTGYQSRSGEAAQRAAETDADDTRELELIPVVNTEALTGHSRDHEALSPLSAAMGGQSAEARPHILVGAASDATKTGMIPVVDRSVDEPPMTVLLTGQPLRPVRHSHADLLGESHDESGTGTSEVPSSTGSAAAAAPASGTGGGSGTAVGSADQAPAAATATSVSDTSAEGQPVVVDTAADDEAETLEGEYRLDEDELTTVQSVRRRRTWFLPAFVALLAILVAVVMFLGYIWTQTQYYVGEDDGEVAIYNGVSQSLGPLHLSEVDEHSGIEVSELTPYHQDRVSGGIAANSRDHAERIVAQLRSTISDSGDEEDQDENADSESDATDEPTDDPTNDQNDDAQDQQSPTEPEGDEQ